MPAMELDILTPAGFPLGFGPITSVQFFDWSNDLDKAGTVSATVPWSDPRTDQITPRQQIRCSTLTGGRWQAVGTGIIDSLTEDMQAAQATLLSIQGHDLLIALADRTVGDLRLSTGTTGETPMPAADLLPAIMAFAPAGWSVVGVPSDATYLAFGGESVLAALGKLAGQLGDHFRLDAPQTVRWLPRTSAPVASGVRALGNVPNPALIDATTCLITRLNRKRDMSQQATRVYAYGGGNGTARTTLAGATYTLPAGYSYGADASGAYIRQDAADAAGRIDALMTFQDVAALEVSPGHADSAANALAQTAVVWLARHVATYYSYTLEVAGLARDVLPGQTIRVVHDTYAAGRRVAIIDADLLVLGTKRRLDSDGSPPLVSLTVASTDRWPEDDSTLSASNAIRTQAQSSHLQVAQRAEQAGTVVDTNVAHVDRLNTFLRAVTIDGSVDETQLRVEAATGQTQPIVQIVDPAGAVLLGVAPTGALTITNTPTPPATPTGGGVIYVESGQLKYRGSAGTVSVVAPA